MEIGISTACFYPTLTENTLETISQLGFQKIEVFFNAACETDVEYCMDFRKAADKLGLKIISVHPFCGAYEYINLFSLYPRRREDAKNDYRKIATAARILGASFITFHGDRIDTPTHTSIELYCEVVKELIDLTKEQDLHLAQENVSWCKSGNLKFLSEVNKNLSTYDVKYTLDVKQSVRAGNRWEEYVSIMGENLVNVHINDHKGKESCLLPGEGGMDYHHLFHELKRVHYGGDCLIEVYSKNYKDIVQIQTAKEYLMTFL